MNNLNSIAKTLVASGKGILAADWSFGTIEKQFSKIDIESTEESRRSYREMFFTTPGIEKYISGVIFFDETVYQKTKDGIPFPQVLEKKGIIPGVRADEGSEPFRNDKEMVTKGLKDLPERLSEYKKMGLKFTKWRMIVYINEIYPSKEAVLENAKRLAEYAKISQENGFVPIVEPEILMEGEHTITKCEIITKQTLKTVFEELEKKQVSLEELLLKPNMILPGKDSLVKSEPREVAQFTLRAFEKTVPKEIPGIVFLSGGQSPEESTTNLNAINSQGSSPWELSFSYARALQEPALMAWKGKHENVTMAKEVFYKRAKLNSLARQGKYKPEMEKD